MSAGIELSAVQGNLVVFNVLWQTSVLAVAALVLAARFKHSAARRYHILFPALGAMLLVLISSTALQLTSANLVTWSLTPPEKLTAEQVSTNELRTAQVENAEFTFEKLLPWPLQLDAFAFADDLSGSLAAGIWYVLQIPAGALLLWVWGSGVMLALFGLGRSIHHLHGLRVTSRALSASETKIVQQALGMIAASPVNITIRCSSAIASPVLLGWRDPVLLLPPALFRAIGQPQLRDILLHELAHLQRNDNLMNFLQKLMLAVLWMQPLAHVLDRRISAAREEICDNAALAQVSAVEYGETLLLAGALAQRLDQTGRLGNTRLAMQVVHRHWSLEERIANLLSDKREINMINHSSFRNLSVVMILCSGLLLATSSVSMAGNMPQDTTANPASDSDAQAEAVGSGNAEEQLSEPVFRAIQAIQEALSPQDAADAPDLDLAKAQLDALYEAQFATGNSFEKVTMLNFYTNYYLMRQDYAGAIGVFEQILDVEKVRADIRLRATRSLGQLYAAEEHWQQSLDAYALWRAESAVENQLVFRGLAYGHYQLEQFEQALPHWLDYMALQEEQDIELGRDDYAFLNGLYFTLGDYDSALENTKEMILKFNNQTDWDNLRAIHAELDRADTDSVEDANA